MPGRILQKLHEYLVTGLPHSTILYHAGGQIGLRSTNLVIREHSGILFLNIPEYRIQVLLVCPLDKPLQISAQTCDLRLYSRISVIVPSTAPILSSRV